MRFTGWSPFNVPGVAPGQSVSLRCPEDPQREPFNVPAILSHAELALAHVSEPPVTHRDQGARLPLAHELGVPRRGTAQPTFAGGYSVVRRSWSLTSCAAC